MTTILYYAHDPMCSWCWAYRPTWRYVYQTLPEDIKLVRLLGGLAPDSDTAMPAAQREMLQAVWHDITARVPGTQFNFDFWSKCRPRRSTYPACRAVIAATRQQADKYEAMTEAIQEAYYLEARNPSENVTLIGLARKLELNLVQFEQQLNAAETQQELLNQIELCCQLGITGFPNLVVYSNNIARRVPVEFNDSQLQVQLILSAAGLAA